MNQTEKDDFVRLVNLPVTPGQLSLRRVELNPEPCHFPLGIFSRMQLGNDKDRLGVSQTRVLACSQLATLSEAANFGHIWPRV